MSNSAKGSALPFYLSTAAFSVAVNLLMLVTPLYMLQIYDRVLTSGSMETLTLVSIAAVGLLFAYGFAESARRKSQILLADFVQAKYGHCVFRSGFADPKKVHDVPGKLGNITTVQGYYLNGLALPFYDLPFTPLFFFAMFLVHPLIGWLGLSGAVVLVLITIVTELNSRGKIKTAQKLEQETTSLSQFLVRNFGAISGLGMERTVFERWSAQKRKASKMLEKSSSFSSFFSAQAKGLRLMLQIGALGIGAWLVLQQQVTAGAIVAGSILLGRALAPIDQLLAGWRQVVKHRNAWTELRESYNDPAAKEVAYTPLPKPNATLQMHGVKVGLPGSENALLPKFNLQVSGGTIVLLLGQSGSGKTSLLQSISGVWPLFDGSVQLGGRDIHSWPREDRGQFIGYSGQEAELLPGTIAENICRFRKVESEEVVNAVQTLGFHEAVLKFENGYDTEIGASGVHLSRGQQQMISLARAFFGTPVLFCLDEPSANLDPITFGHLKRALQSVRADGGICFVSTHDTRLLDLADQVLILAGGSIKMASGADYRATLMRPAERSAHAKGVTL